MFRTVFTTFCLIFMAELGDKTQLATMLMATKCDKAWPVFLGSSMALILSSFIGVIAGETITKIIPIQYIHTAAGLGFIIIGILLLLGKI